MHEAALSQKQAKANALGANTGSAAGKMPGDPGIWTFITADVMLFFVLFIVFMVERLGDPGLYEKSRQLLNANFGFVNTLVLLTSSWFVALAVDASRHGDRTRVTGNLKIALLVGSIFAILKLIEYAVKIRSGITPLTNPFFTYYYGLTAIHFMHYVVGMGVLIVCLAKAYREPVNEKYLMWIESSGCCWYMVDMLWIVLFPTLYLMRAS